MADLGFTGAGTVIKTTVHDHAAAHTAAHVNPEDTSKPLPCPPQCLSEGGHIGIILDGNRHSGELANPVSQRKIMPARHLMRATNLAGLRVHRPTKTHAHRGDAMPGHQPRNHGSDLFPNPSPTPSSIGCQAMALQEGPVGTSRHDLDLGTPDFDSNMSHRCRRKPFAFCLARPI